MITQKEHISFPAMVDELTNEVENIARNDLEGNLNQLKKCREFLHCNHSILTELRVRKFIIEEWLAVSSS